ncbi:DNA-3-methyladenine glycosylase I [Humibacter ginsenosidimutans]|uniref:DNA-3-methyladenine glycosylase I n=1 Tax=Humibacter ginsenosidimutans TaxID=2599293 RepID=A0A5B8MA71_9MICO|nr:DNA-3-methyladenine glycosylase I [Humibacter ginsenosidimutans]QDZ16555.1 DNA-3-methyladenine glycosylase I [Humibacter ginsenosidimutans]
MNATTNREAGTDAPARDDAPVTPRRPDLVIGDDDVARCGWIGTDVEYRRYHDEEWGRPLRDDRRLFEKICLEGFQAGLSWRTILLRRPAFREAFHGFDPASVAAMDESDVERLLTNAEIIRHRGKIEATIANARATMALDEPLNELIWSFAPDAMHDAPPASMSEVPAITPESTALSKRLRGLGFRFVGPTTMYALMQSAGLVDDHLAGCWLASDAQHDES